MRRIAFLAAALIGASLLITGCARRVDVSQPPAAGTASEARAEGFTAFPDLPMPVKSKLNVDKTLIFGAGESWFGRLVITAPHGTDDMFDFYRQGLPGYGWEEITSVRAATSVLTYSRGERVATLQIEGASIQGSEISITVSPRGGANVPPASTAPAPVQRLQ